MKLLPRSSPWAQRNRLIFPVCYPHRLFFPSHLLTAFFLLSSSPSCWTALLLPPGIALATRRGKKKKKIPSCDINSADALLWIDMADIAYMNQFSCLSGLWFLMLDKGVPRHPGPLKVSVAESSVLCVTKIVYRRSAIGALHHLVLYMHAWHIQSKAYIGYF